MREHHEQSRWYSVEVHQAEGMLTERLHITIDQAVEALRDYAAHTDRTLQDAACEVIRRGPGPNPWS